MGSKSQRRKERHSQKRKAKQKERSQARQQTSQPETEIALGSNVRHRQRLAQQTPVAWPGEIPEDIAIFDDSVISTLSPEIAAQVSVVREALCDATESRGEEAVKRTSVISRSSSLSEWRLFIRGLVDWMADHFEAASESWTRLDFNRRPGRMAKAMMLATRTDLEQVSHPEESEQPAGDSEPAPWSQGDDQLLYHAKLLRRVRFDRAALRVAQTALSLPEESKELVIGPRKLRWLSQFVKEYADTEPELAAALSHAALGRAFGQQYSDLFDVAVQTLPGPRHDRRSKLLTFFYYRQFGQDSTAERRSERALDQYLTRDLPQNESISESLRSAIVSQIHFNEAMELMQPDRGGGFMDFFAPPEDAKGIRKYLDAALKATPRNRSAHEAYSGWLVSKLEDDRLTQIKRMPLEKELANVMRRWSKGLPEDVEPRLWLVDYLLENEELEEAKPHVDFLAASRADDPRVRATPWKWQVLEAMRLCRRKAWLADVPARLDEAESLWPAWLPKQWLAYLRAAWMLRSGQPEAFENQRQQICQTSGLARDALADACMMLGAAQMMRVPASDLKPLRAPVDQALKKLKTLSLDELLQAGGFFWDLQRVKLLYPAYRMHGNNIGKELFARLAKNAKVVLDGVNDERVHKVLFWGSESRFWSSNYQTRKLPFFSKPIAQQHPMFVAARLNAFLKERYAWGIDQYKGFGSLLREAAPLQRDSYYRYWFVSLADNLDDLFASESSSPFGIPFGRSFEGQDGDDDDIDDFLDGDFEEEDDDFDPDCNCADCQAARRAYEKKRSSTGDESPF